MRLRSLLLLLCVSSVLSASEKPKTAVATAEQLWQDLAAGNVRFVEGKPKVRDLPADRAKLTKSQSPKVAVLACADSRVGPELVFDKTVGDLFVVRNAGNTPDPLAIGSLEYAVEHLGTTMIVVMGHQACGAVKAACSGEKMPTPNLDAVVSPIKRSCTSPEKDGNAAVRDHVHQAALMLLANSPVLKHAAEAGELTIVEAYYSLDSGKVERLH